MCMSANKIPSGKSILLLGIFMPFGAVKGGQSHENNQYWHSCPCRRRENNFDRKGLKQKCRVD